MYCVACGVSLTSESRAGLVCTVCRLPPMRVLGSGAKRFSRIEVKYCFWCGKPYRSTNETVHHRRLLSGECNVEVQHEQYEWG